MHPQLEEIFESSDGVQEINPNPSDVWSETDCGHELTDIYLSVDYKDQPGIAYYFGKTDAEVLAKQTEIQIKVMEEQSDPRHREEPVEIKLHYGFPQLNLKWEYVTDKDEVVRKLFNNKSYCTSWDAGYDRMFYLI